jgi:hypothetical protein
MFVHLYQKKTFYDHPHLKLYSLQDKKISGTHFHLEYFSGFPALMDKINECSDQVNTKCFK